MKVVCLGAGLDIGRSCLILSLGGYNVMLDCGVHMGLAQKFPSFEYISSEGRMTEAIDVVIISHYHLDHIGALPYFTEKCGYEGVILMTAPTKAIAPLVLGEFTKTIVDDTHSYTVEDVTQCVKRISTIGLEETWTLNNHLKITLYYAGHVLGAAVTHIECGTESIVYTGDFNTLPSINLRGGMNIFISMYLSIVHRYTLL